ncbi:MAG: ABC transporter ATP-binding protein [Planctomycetes bacterium]|nr:ABC transporter ATP-binding protein [Planctomycetota bacterium]
MTESHTESNDECAIALTGVRKCYGQTVAVRDLTLSVPRGELFAFLGPNGAGKTTTIKMIVGLLQPSAGTVRVCGRAIGSNGVAAKIMTAYVPDQPFIYEKLTGREFLYFVAEMYGLSKERRDRKLASLLDRFDIGAFLDQLTESYSHGMKQKIVLAAAFLHEPRVLVIDEPMVGLDPRTVRSVKDLFLEHTGGGGTVFMSTHTLAIAEQVADRIGIINKGELIAIGTLAELRARARQEHSLEEIFLRLTEAGDDDDR